VNVASLPYTVLLLLLELAVGSLALVTVFDARRQVTAGYVKAGASLVAPMAGLALWTYATIDRVDEVDGYALDGDWLRPAGIALGLFFLVTLGYMAASFSDRRNETIWLGAIGTIAGTVALALFAALIAAPVWSYLGALLSVLASAAVLGGALMAMTWGHWYLTSGRLPKEPMEQMSLVVLGALALQAVLVVLGALAPVRNVPLTEAAFGVGLAENPAFWLRIGVGLLCPAVAALLAWRSARIRGMMSATGLLYIALGAVLAGEVLARGLLFSTGSAV
jgi:hypothetical protein